MENKDKELFYIWKRNRGYYRRNFTGYTDDKKYAGVYSNLDSWNEISKHTTSNIFRIPIIISEHNKLIKNEIENLENNLILTK